MPMISKFLPGWFQKGGLIFLHSIHFLQQRILAEVWRKSWQPHLITPLTIYQRPQMGPWLGRPAARKKTSRCSGNNGQAYFCLPNQASSQKRGRAKPSPGISPAEEGAAFFLQELCGREIHSPSPFPFPFPPPRRRNRGRRAVPQAIPVSVWWFGLPRPP